MSSGPVSRSKDLRRLQADGYAVRLVNGKLVIDDIPYVDDQQTVYTDGVLVMPITLAGDIAQPPGDHTAHWIGKVPCSTAGERLYLVNTVAEMDLGDGLVASCYFSRKPADLPNNAYPDYHAKVTAYANAVAGPAAEIDATVTPLQHKPVTADEIDGPFLYIDTASSRAGIDALNERLDDEILGIIGIGGTGAFLADLAAKTRVPEIHLFDGDVQLSHNAFRSPGAMSIDELRAKLNKAEHWATVHARMRSGIVAHPEHVTDANLHLLDHLTFVFLAVDDPEAKKPIIDHLQANGIPFIDVGMGLELAEAGLTGTVRTTTSTPDWPAAASRIDTGPAGYDDEYSTNVQIVELNALNACLAIIKWKKLHGIYADLEHEHHSDYAITTNFIINEEKDRPDEPKDEESSG